MLYCLGRSVKIILGTFKINTQFLDALTLPSGTILPDDMGTPIP
jgi:hypothetical protein